MEKMIEHIAEQNRFILIEDGETAARSHWWTRDSFTSGKGGIRLCAGTRTDACGYLRLCGSVVETSSRIRRPDQSGLCRWGMCIVRMKQIGIRIKERTDCR